MRLLALLTTLVALAQASAVEPASHRQLDEAQVAAAPAAQHIPTFVRAGSRELALGADRFWPLTTHHPLKFPILAVVKRLSEYGSPENQGNRLYSLAVGLRISEVTVQRAALGFCRPWTLQTDPQLHYTSRPVSSSLLSELN